MKEDLDLAELAHAAAVTPRTVRYYLHQGLLPSPGSRGPGTRYDRSLLDRLQLIKLLQRDQWPLAKIREYLEQLDDDGVRAALGQPPELPLSDSALRYVRTVMTKGQHHVAEPTGKRGRQRDLFAASAPASPRLEIRKSTWVRIRITPNVELSVRKPLGAEQGKLVDRLIEAARKIFEEET